LKICPLNLNMGTSEIISEINKLPVNERLAIIEAILRNIRTEGKKQRLTEAADLMYNDYLTDPELTAFTRLIP
jgi:hypothetical protein